MANRLVKRLAIAIVLGIVAGNSFAAGVVKPLELSVAINQARLFAVLTDKERAAVKEVATLRHGQKGERLIERGQSLDRMYVILDGQAGVMVDGKLVATLPEQSLLGEIEFFDTLPAIAEVTLLQECYVIELNNEALKTLMNRQSRIGYKLMSEIARIEAQRLRAMDEK